MRALPVVLVAGFLAVLVVAWHHGERGKQRVGRMEVVTLAGVVVLAAMGIRWVGAGGEAESEIVSADLPGLPAIDLDETAIAVLPVGSTVTPEWIVIATPSSATFSKNGRHAGSDSR